MATTKNLMPLIPAAGNLPAHLAKSQGLGNENIGSSDLAVPRINMLQSLSPQLDESKVEYVEGAKAGRFFNTVTNEVSESILCLNIYYDHGYVVWRKREFGGGFIGSFESAQAAANHLATNNMAADQFTVSETADHYLLLLDDKGGVKGPAIMSLSSTKLQMSRQWNSAIQKACSDNGGLDRFAPGWKLTPVKKSNTKGSWYVMDFELAGWASEEQYAMATQAYENIVAGKEAAKVA